MNRLATNIREYVECNTEEHFELADRYVKSLKIAGWSTCLHKVFFEACGLHLTSPRILMCGVYHGMDLRLLRHEFYDSIPTIIGVDLFSDEPCRDWTPEQRGKTWEENGFGPPPSIENAHKNCPDAILIKSDSIHFMRSCVAKFDMIYLDTSHDYDTVKLEIEAAKRIIHPDGIICGDDYGEIPEWGVERAVKESFREKLTFNNRIWMANL